MPTAIQIGRVYSILLRLQGYNFLRKILDCYWRYLGAGRTAPVRNRSISSECLNSDFYCRSSSIFLKIPFNKSDTGLNNVLVSAAPLKDTT